MNSKLRKTASALAIAAAALTLTAGAAGAREQQQAAPAGAEAAFPQEASDLEADPRVIYGRLDNGLRYAVMRNQTPKGVAALRMRIDTGSWNETEEQRGIAHFLEHMAFNGSRNVPEGEMVKRLERHGLAFGADTNASTGFDQTVYKLNLPTVSDEVIEEAFFLMRETASNLLLDAEAIERERGVIASEKSARDSVGFRSAVDNLAFFTHGSGRVDRLPIGVDETIASMPREEFVRFYRDYYRPENTFIVFVGDVDPAVAIAKIESHFGDWRPAPPAGSARPLVPATIEPGRIGYYQDPEVLTYVTLASLYPYEQGPDTLARRRANFLRDLGNSIVSRRLSRMVDEGEAPFLAGSLASYSQRDIVDGVAVRVRSEEGKWQESLAAADVEIRRALEFGFTQAELDEQLARRRRSLETAVERADTRKTYASRGYNHAKALVDAFDSERVFTSPQANLAAFETFAEGLTPADVEAAFRRAWRAYDKPAIYLSTALELDDVEAQVSQALAQARTLPVSAPAEREIGDFAFTDFGGPGTVVEDRHVEDADAHLVKFANNVRLNFKQTDFDAGTIYVQVRIGDGFFSMPQGADEGLRRLAVNLLGRSGVGPHTSEDLRTIFAGRRLGARPMLRVGEDAIEILGATDAADLADQMNLMAAYALAPSYRQTIADRYRDQIRAWYPTHDSTPISIANKEIPRLVRSGDERYGYGDLESFMTPTLEEARQWLDPQLREGLIEVTVVGDVEKQAVVDQVARTFGALPERADRPGDYPGARDLAFPDRPAEPVVLRHSGVADQALARVYWPGPDGFDPVTVYRLEALRSILRNRLTDVLREELGSTYSPGVGVEASDEAEGYGYIFAHVTTAPDAAFDVIAETEKVGARLAAEGVEADEFKRAIQPLIEDLASSLQNNAYWMNVLGDAQTDGVGLARFRAREQAYREMTADDVSALAERIFRSERAYPVAILPVDAGGEAAD
ncbi:M16 family metallopeptidase [Pelagerythrobacter marinus]|uniref:M16 family metallopeptidase n=1 Tax=Pelagerythrobacter marinus TaxID=538382 RepID=UPI002036C8DD|nr:M16 family metallopeptidase [Pelagerythrobacter marinus]USA38526.1 insulinase family protein [Pelagerythrobacter marinus]WPZ07449.1 insulinase family protein [Pelagerythrobacter marinus]